MSAGQDRLSEAARALLARRAGVNAGTGPQPGAAGETAPLATPQLGQWLSSQVQVAGTLGSLPKVLRLDGPLDRSALRRSLTEITRRHQILRTVYSVRDGEPKQRVLPPPELELPEVDLRHMPREDRTGAARAVLEQDARRPFDLTRDLMVRPLLVRLEDEVHEFQVTFQHVAFDGWSNGIYLRELGVLYSAFAAGRPSPLAELPVQYADFAVWERNRETTSGFQADLAYWKSQVSGSTSALGLLTDRLRTRQRSLARASVAAHIDASLTQRLSRLALEEATTLFAVTFAAFQVLVGRRAGCDDFVLGTVSANRTQRETEALIGSFITVLPMRARLQDAPRFRTHLQRTAESIARGFTHQAFPFQRLMADLRPGGDPVFDPLYDVLFNYRSMPVSLPEMDRLAVSDFRAPHLDATCDLHLNVTPGDDGLALELEYNPDLFREATAVRWLDGYRALLEAVAEDPDASTLRLPVMPDGERRLLLETWSTGPAVPPGLGLFLDMFERSVAANPDFPAVEHGDQMVGYGELRTRTLRLAAHLLDSGVTRGDCVGVACGRSADTIAAALAILWIGAVYVPFDAATPVRRMDAMLETAGIRLILADERGTSMLRARAERVLLIADLLGQEPASAATRAELGEDDPAYLIFTSGSTGIPKGVLISHGALAQFAPGCVGIVNLRAQDRLLLFHELTFDTSIEEIFAPLSIGATIVVRPESMIDSPAICVEQIRLLRLTHAILPTGFWSEVVTAPWPDGMDFGELRTLAIGGEAAAPDTLERFFSVVAPKVRLINGYGPTETTVVAAWAELTAGEEYPGEVPIGQPYWGTILLVVDSLGQPVPIGAPGELWIGGGAVGLGYLGAPELTAQRFVGDPRGPGSGHRFYRTGDRVRWRDDGQLGYLGRADLQLKVRGYRIDPGEVEHALRRAPGVRQAVVMLHPAVRDRLVAFVVADPGHPLDVQALRDTIANDVPHYMVPGEIVQIERLPLGSTGKVDRKRLGTMMPAASDQATVAPSTPTERTVARIWEEALGVSGIGAHDRFLDLGGHSILAMRIANRLRAEFGVDLTIRTLLNHPTVATLARELDRTGPLVVEPRQH